jgi:hypothetical protein
MAVPPARFVCDAWLDYTPQLQKITRQRPLEPVSPGSARIYGILLDLSGGAIQNEASKRFDLIAAAR